MIKDVDKKMPNTSELIKNVDYNTKITKIENRIPYTIDLVTTTALNAKIIEIENKIPDVTNLATKSALNTKAAETENEIPDTSHFINTQAFNKLTKISVDARMKEAEKLLQVVNKSEKKKKNFERLIQVISLVKVILKKMERKLVYYFSRFLSILKRCAKGYSMEIQKKILNLQLHLIIVLIQ